MEYAGFIENPDAVYTNFKFLVCFQASLFNPLLCVFRGIVDVMVDVSRG